MEELIKILEKFDSERCNFFGTNEWNENKVAECFYDCAKDILCGGYFLIEFIAANLINNKIIDINQIELYYHEEGENGKIKDPIMYHTNDRGSYSKFYKKDKGLPYFVMGSFNPHTSGIDVTFESETNQYRASFLIRSYRVLDDKNDLNSDKIKYDTCSTHIYDDMFPLGFFFGNNEKYKIKWVSDNNKCGHIEYCKRINVAEYKKDDGQYKKIELQNINGLNQDSYFKSGSKYYQKETRNWGFIRIINNK